MKQVVRFNSFETNSSSVHTLVMCSEEEFNKWKNGELLFVRYEHQFISVSDKPEDADDDYEYQTYDEFMDDYDFETFEQTYTTKSGEKVVAFGYYGYDG